MDTDLGRGDEKKLVKDVLAPVGTTLISWQHGGIPEIVDDFPSVHRRRPRSGPTTGSTCVWTLTRTADGWHFTQTPQLVLPQDSRVIEADHQRTPDTGGLHVHGGDRGRRDRAVFDFTNGFHDTANAMATSIATGALRPKVAVLLAGVLNLVGAFLSVAGREDHLQRPGRRGAASPRR